jgi:hypothetical protein
MMVARDNPGPDMPTLSSIAEERSIGSIYNIVVL